MFSGSKLISGQNAHRALWILVLVLIFWQACKSSPHPTTSLINDKLAHFMCFAVLAYWGYFVWSRPTNLKVLLLFLALYGLSIETVQYFVPDRDFSLADWVMDLLGLILAMLLIKLQVNYTHKGGFKLS